MYRTILLALTLSIGCDAFSTVADEPPPPQFCDESGAESDCTELAAPRHPRILPNLITAAAPPVPLSGGTLLVSQDGTLALAAESDRDQVQVVALDADVENPIVATLRLEPGDEPGRVVQARDRFYVVLRGGGAIQRIDTAHGWSLGRRIPVCAAPRGVAYDSESETLLATCVGGDLVELDESTGEEKSRVHLATDLRDVIVTESKIFVSRFRSADVLVLSKARALLETVRLSEHYIEDFTVGIQTANVAYRMIQMGPDEVIVSHQLSAVDRPISAGRSGAYGGGGCDGSIVQAALSVVDAAGAVVMSAQDNLVLPVDVALAPVGSSVDRLGNIAIAAAGTRTDGIPSGTRTDGIPSGVAYAWRSVAPGQEIASSGCASNPRTTDQTVAVAFEEYGTVVRQTRSPHALFVFGREIQLPGPDTTDAGHDLFFGDAGAGIACASCHAEGGDDALTWNFAGIGPRRTQELRGGIMGSAPFHWDGDMDNFAELADDVMTVRMGGPWLPLGHLEALASFIDSMSLPPRAEASDSEAVARGAEIFSSEEAACSSCHTDERLSGPGSFDVGTGLAVQVPGLIGLSLRSPFMHDGCAETVGDRFDPSCGGDAHGSVEHLDARGLADLIAYLEAL